ncbi:MAG TPA: class I SAM-dependent methyltransferase [Myxococcales bacterium]|nr:class I SAM-dependent methyltransferase [Myxococcales bacterium]
MGSSKADIAVSYDVSNEFFRLWLDERMNYTCGIFDDGPDRMVMPPPGHPGERTLEAAQLEKLRILSGFAHVNTSSTVLDIGCGWGANLEYQALQNKVKAAHGITLSEAQCAEIRRRELPGVTAQVCSYLDYKPPVKFDAIISICMMEHIVSPQEARDGKSIAAYRNYFRLAREWTNPGAYFGLQTILRNFVPRDRNDVRDLGWVTYEIFPGGIVPRLEEIIAAVNPYWEVVEVKTRRLDYMKTTWHWRDRLRKNEAKIRATWGDKVYDDYERYLSTCVTGFEKHYQSLAQYSLKRID